MKRPLFRPQQGTLGLGFWPTVMTVSALIAAHTGMELTSGIPEGLGYVHDGGQFGSRNILGAIIESSAGVAGTVFSIAVVVLFYSARVGCLQLFSHEGIARTTGKFDAIVRLNDRHWLSWFYANSGVGARILVPASDCNGLATAMFEAFAAVREVIRDLSCKQCPARHARMACGDAQASVSNNHDRSDIDAQFGRVLTAAEKDYRPL